MLWELGVQFYLTKAMLLICVVGERPMSPLRQVGWTRFDVDALIDCML
jgi:hypothetical protein